MRCYYEIEKFYSESQSDQYRDRLCSCSARRRRHSGGVMLHNHLQSILPSNASFKGVSLSKMDDEQVTAAIENELNQKIAGSDLTVT